VVPSAHREEIGPEQMDQKKQGGGETNPAGPGVPARLPVPVRGAAYSISLRVAGGANAMG